MQFECQTVDCSTPQDRRRRMHGYPGEVMCYVSDFFIAIILRLKMLSHLIWRRVNVISLQYRALIWELG